MKTYSLSLDNCTIAKHVKEKKVQSEELAGSSTFLSSWSADAERFTHILLWSSKHSKPLIRAYNFSHQSPFSPNRCFPVSVSRLKKKKKMENSSPLNSCIWKSVVLSVLITVETHSMPRRTAHSRDTRGALRSNNAGARIHPDA